MLSEKLKHEMDLIDAEKEDDDAGFYVRAIERLMICERRLKTLNRQLLHMRVEMSDAKLEYLKTMQDMKMTCNRVQEIARYWDADCMNN